MASLEAAADLDEAGMAFANPEIRNFRGLYLQANSFGVPDGALEVAENIVSTSDGVITKARGFYTWHMEELNTLKGLTTFQNHIIAATNTSIRYFNEIGPSPNEMGDPTTLPGAPVVITGNASRFMGANNNLYFTTDNGPLKLSAYNSKVSPVGAPPALDIDLEFIPGVSSGWLSPDSVVAYRVVFGYTDANDNLILSAPSDIGQIVNQRVEADSYGVSGTGPWTVTVTKADHGLTTGNFLNIKDENSATDDPEEGIYQITVLSPDTFSYEVSSAVDAPTPDTSKLSFGFAHPVRVTATIPTEITAEERWFAQLYRTTAYEGYDLGVSVIGDFKLVEQRDLTPAEIAAHEIVFTDDVPNNLLSDAELYTNQNSREGELAANLRPPKCADMTLYKGHAVYAQCTNRHYLNLDVIDSLDLTEGSFVEIKVGDVIRRYTEGTDFIASESDVASVRLRDTAKALVKAINRDAASPVYAQYTSLPDDTPGHMRLTMKGFGGAIYVRANTAAVGEGFLPALPGSFDTGEQVYSRGEAEPHAIYVSKQNEPEAVPVSNFIPVGAKNKRLVRVHALRDSLILLKEDGVFRLTGDSVANFTVTLVDSTVQIIAARSSDVLNNQVVFLSNQGVCLVSEASVQIVSRQIKDVIQPVLGQTAIDNITAGVGYESEQLYYLTTGSPSGQDLKTYVYNVQTDAWTSITTYFTHATMGPRDTIFLISQLNEILKERKKQTKLDYSGQNFDCFIESVADDKLSADVVFPDGITPEDGDVLVKSEVISRVSGEPLLVGFNAWRLKFDKTTNLEAEDEVFLYSRLVSTIKLAPFHAGLVGKAKHFSQMQVHLRDDSTSKLTISFTGNTFGSSEIINWVSQLTRPGWGLFPWAFAPFGQADSIYLTQGTNPAPIIRVLVPSYQARNTFIQPYITHKEAAEPLNFQALSFAVRSYAERVSR